MARRDPRIAARNRGPGMRKIRPSHRRVDLVGAEKPGAS
jgi:hypothetical protein